MINVPIELVFTTLKVDTTICPHKNSMIFSTISYLINSPPFKSALLPDRSPSPDCKIPDWNPTTRTPWADRPRDQIFRRNSFNCEKDEKREAEAEGEKVYRDRFWIGVFALLRGKDNHAGRIEFEAHLLTTKIKS
jgi:hypothetical protein